MNLTSETKLMIGLAAFILLGGGFLFWSSQPPESPKSRPPAQPVSTDRFDELVKNAAHVKGDVNAKYTMIEFADFECPTCRRTYKDYLQKLEKRSDIRFAFYNFPLESIHPAALPAAIAAEAAGRQGKFWEMYDALFSPDVIELDQDALIRQVEKVSLNKTQFEQDRKDPALEKQVRDQMKQGDAYQVSATPTFILRGPDGKILRAEGRSDFDKMARQAGLIDSSVSAPPSAPTALPVGP